MADTGIRKSVPLTVEDREHIQRLRTPDSAEREALAAVTGIELGGQVSEAEALHALPVAGRAALTEQVTLSGYAALAAAQDDEAAPHSAPYAPAQQRGETDHMHEVTDLAHGEHRLRVESRVGDLSTAHRA
ncbi:hypothetical protein LO772_29070 [Yinghuangia sp. ASG 101]|uniref:hypothetical protein n=1 Tax=Yinghuangia sp. ASG 101 TaxID=2896848 RepID=UPI001E414988|nr:hypothetical protein [Yinghuangia sp. ASG 101]UGQ10827.1 hypothetical protein LO772_29070 [Yinghuangia sp. ASG 101]